MVNNPFKKIINHSLRKKVFLKFVLWVKKEGPLEREIREDQED